MNYRDNFTLRSMFEFIHKTVMSHGGDGDGIVLLNLNEKEFNDVIEKFSTFQEKNALNKLASFRIHSQTNLTVYFIHDMESITFTRDKSFFDSVRCDAFKLEI